MPSNPSKTYVMAIEDEPAIADMIDFALTSKGFKVLTCLDTPAAKQALHNRSPHLIILDWMLPTESGYMFLQWLRRQASYQSIPVIMLTAKAEEQHKIKALEGGADDYITKPFSPAELSARIKSILRRGQIQAPHNVICYHDLKLDIEQHQASIAGKQLKLSPMEYKLLHFFMTHPQRTYSRNQIITQVWGSTTYIDERTIDVQIRRLRDKLKPQHQHMIKTIRGSGYQFNQQAD